MTTSVINSAVEMMAFGAQMAPLLKGVVALRGDLGAGKTTFIKGVISTLAGIDPSLILSPTFNIINVYGDVSHFDCYRLHDAREFFARGLEEYLENSPLCLIEWDERVLGAIPEKKTIIEILIKSETQRVVHIEAY